MPLRDATLVYWPPVSRRRLVAWLVLTVGLALFPCTPTSSAQPAGTLDRLVGQLDRQLMLALRGRALQHLRLAVAFRGDSGVAPRLVQVVRRLLIGQLSRTAWGRLQTIVAAATAPTRANLARRAGFEFLLDLSLSTSGDQLHLKGELRDVAALLWRDIVMPEHGSMSHLHTNVRIDAEVRAYQHQRPASRLAFALSRSKYPDDRVVQLSAGDVDGDGRDDLVALSSDSIAVLTADAGTGTFTPRARLPLPGPPAQLSSRRSIGTLLVQDLDGDGRIEIYARSSSYPRGAQLSYGVANTRTLHVERTFDGYPLMAGASSTRSADSHSLVRAYAAEGADYFMSSTITLHPARGVPHAFYALKSIALRSANGAQHEYAAVVDLGGELRLLDGSLQQVIATLQRAGVAFALADLNGNGELNLISSAASDLSDKDRLSIYRVTVPGGELRQIWRSMPVDGKIITLTHGDFDGDGRVEVVAIVEGPHGHPTLLRLE